MTYPTLDEVASANGQQILMWDRRLPEPRTADERAVAEAIVGQFNAGGGVIGTAKESLRDAGFGDLFG